MRKFSSISHAPTCLTLMFMHALHPSSTMPLLNNYYKYKGDKSYYRGIVAFDTFIFGTKTWHRNELYINSSINKKFFLFSTLSFDTRDGCVKCYNAFMFTIVAP